jgi:hypothetical protein
MLMRMIGYRIWILIMLGMASCDESLPPRDEPEDYLDTRMNVLGGRVAFQIGETSPSMENGAFFITMKNLYSEVLQESAFVLVETEVYLKDRPNEKAIVRADERHLMNKTTIIRGRLATLAPDSVATWQRQWEHKTEYGKPFWDFSPLTIGYTKSGKKYYDSEELHFVARSKARLFKQAPMEQTLGIEFALAYRIYVIDTIPFPTRTGTIETDH